MPANDLLTRYAGFATNLGLDLVAIFLMTYALYFRRHWRSDLLLSYVALNMGIFVVMSVLSNVRVDIAVGFGLFAILSIIRLRSSAVTQQEVAYYFVALVLGLINGINLSDRVLLVAMNVVLLLTMFAFDSKPLRDRARRADVRLDKVYTDSAALVAELERLLHGRVVYQEVSEIDFIHHHMTIDVRYRTGPGYAPPRHDEPSVGTPAAGATSAVEADATGPGEPAVSSTADGRHSGYGPGAARPDQVG